MISNISNTKRILDKYQLRAKKNFGQNFLVDENILNKIIKEARIDQECGVIEIGPGLGSLTEFLAINSKKVLCYEIDKDMVTVLNDTLSDYNNVKIINIDILKANIANDFEYFKDCSRVKVIANLPYYITTAIITKFLELNLEIEDYYFMVQKEVAERLTSKPNTKDYNALSVLMAYRSETKILFNVGKNCFFPAPEVESALILVHPTKVNYNVNFEGKFLKFNQNIFSQRRKTLVNNISCSYPLEKEKIKEVLEKNGINVTARAESLDLVQIINLYKSFFE